jgi:hypothetical protein
VETITEIVLQYRDKKEWATSGRVLVRTKSGAFYLLKCNLLAPPDRFLGMEINTAAFRLASRSDVQPMTNKEACSLMLKYK